MSSQLRVDNIFPSVGTGIGIGTDNGSITFNAEVTGGMNFTSGSVGIGTDNPTELLDIQSNDLPTAYLRNRTTTSYARVLLDEVGDTGGSFTINRLGSTSTAIGGARAGQIWNNANAPIVFGTNGTEAARFNASGNLAFVSGNGIDFSETANSSGSMTSELLDDYEEGTWTPDLRFDGSNTGVTYSWRNGHYTKIGRLVTVRAAFGLTSRGSFTATDRAAIYGLPFGLDPFGISGGFNYSFVGSYSGGVHGIHVIEHQYNSSNVDHFLLSRITAVDTSFSEMQYQHVGGGQRIAFVTTYFAAS